MSGSDRHCALADLLDYHLGELSSAAADALEEHVFECPACATRCQEIDQIATAVQTTVEGAAVGVNATDAFLDRAIAAGLSLRQYRLGPGETVACSAGPEDLYVVRLAADFRGARDLTARVDFRDLASGTTQSLPPREVLADRAVDEVVLVLPGSDVRSYPRSLWTITVEGDVAGEPTSFGPFVMDHTP